ncbi:type I restriction enzyme, S subunit [Marinospirillum celere]|uniref:Type I restriction enzyme, S subunit n=1 Tax=Marinospirillum celere TaxID=1122252 RepID=A0A1I1ENW4_9GAMM|nr:restriction endonuclease subunit S [Marinospirillum celere]SFB88342.1 type I restriction enzyme, S subunit [Marinospirillum celere]
MNSKWHSSSFGDLTDWYSGGTPSKKDPDFWGGDIPWISASSMHGARYSTSDLQITSKGLKAGSRLAAPGSILLLVRGSTLHQRIPVGIAVTDVAFNQDVKAINVKPNLVEDQVIDSWYLFYWIKANTNRLLSMVESTGIGAGKLDTKQLQGLRIDYPEWDEQRRIVACCKSLEEKEIVNHQINQTLEQMAQAIFKSWFVDFEPVKAKMAALEAGGSEEDALLAAMQVISGKPEAALHEMSQQDPEAFSQLAQTARLFPSAMQDSELGEIPEGWEVRRTEDLAEKIGMGPFGSNIKVSTFVDSGVPIISGQHLKELLVTDGENNFITLEHAEKLKNSNVFPEDIVFTHAGNIGQVSLIPKQSAYDKYVISQRQFYLRVDRSKASPYFLAYFFRSPQGQHLLLSNASQVGVPSIARPSSHLKSIEFVTPSFDLMCQFEAVSKSIIEQTVLNRLQSQSLSMLRDTLLPKLLSGELSVADIESDINESREAVDV